MRRLAPGVRRDRLCHPGGNNTDVIGVFPQGVEDLYRITFADGSNVLATNEHIWKYSVATKGKWRKSGLEWKLALTKQLIEMIEVFLGFQVRLKPKKKRLG